MKQDKINAKPQSQEEILHYLMDDRLHLQSELIKARRKIDEFISQIKVIQEDK